MIFFVPSKEPVTCDSHKFSCGIAYPNMLGHRVHCSNAVLEDLDIEHFTDNDTYKQMEFLVNVPELFVIKVSDQVLKEKIRLFTPEDLDAWLGESHEHLPLSYAGYDINTYEYGALLLKLYTMADIDSFAYAVRTDYCPTSGVYSVCIATINEDFWTSDHTIPIQALVEAINILREQLSAYGIEKANLSRTKE